MCVMKQSEYLVESIYLSIYLSNLWPYPWHMEVSRPGTESMSDPLTHGVGPGLEPASPQGTGAAASDS